MRIDTALLHDGQAAALRVWAAWRAPLVALAAGLLAAAAARGLRSQRLTGSSIGIAAVAGFGTLAGLTWPATSALQRLAPVAAGATVVALLTAAAGRRAGLVGVALMGGWFLAGGPLHRAPSLPWIEAGGAAAVLALGAFVLAGLGGRQVVLAAASLACGLSAAGVSRAWVLAALVPGAATLGAATLGAATLGASLGGSGSRAPHAVLPAAVAVAAVAAAWLLSTGDLARLSPRPAEAAVLAPVLALWLAVRLAPRLHVAASGIGLAAATLAVWMIAGGR